MLTVTYKNSTGQDRANFEASVDHANSSRNWYLTFAAAGNGAGQPESRAALVQSLTELKKDIEETIHALLAEEI